MDIDMQHFNSLGEAAKYAGVSVMTVRSWCKDFHIGHMEKGQWRIDKDKLDRVIHAKDQIREIKSSLLDM